MFKTAFITTITFIIVLAITDAEMIALVRDETGLIRLVDGLAHPASMKTESKALFTPAFSYLSFTVSNVVEASIPCFIDCSDGA